MPLTSRWKRIISQELSLNSIHKDILELQDHALYWILTPISHIIVGSNDRIRSFNNKRAVDEVETLLLDLGFTRKQYIYSLAVRAYETSPRKGQGTYRVEFGYYETSDGVWRDFDFYLNHKNLGKKKFLEWLIKERRKLSR